MKKGFTLIELLIVVAIIAILAAIAVPNFLEAQVRAKVSRVKADQRTMATAMEAYFVDYNVYTRDSDSSLDYKDVVLPGGIHPSLDPSHTSFTHCANGALQLTTPIAFLNELLDDPFANSVAIEGAGARGYRIGSGTWSYKKFDSGSGIDVLDEDGSTISDSPVINPHDDQLAHEVFNLVGPKPTYVIIGVGPDGSRARMAYKNFPYMSNYEADEGGISENIASDHSPQPLCFTDYDSTNGTVSIGDVYRFGGSYRSVGRFMYNGETLGDQTANAGFTDPTTHTITTEMDSKNVGEFIIW